MQCDNAISARLSNRVLLTMYWVSATTVAGRLKQSKCRYAHIRLQLYNLALEAFLSSSRRF